MNSTKALEIRFNRIEKDVKQKILPGNSCQMPFYGFFNHFYDEEEKKLFYQCKLQMMRHFFSWNIKKEGRKKHSLRRMKSFFVRKKEEFIQ